MCRKPQQHWLYLNFASRPVLKQSIRGRRAVTVCAESKPEQMMWSFTLFIGVDDSAKQEDMSSDKVFVISVSRIIYRGLIHGTADRLHSQLVLITISTVPFKVDFYYFSSKYCSNKMRRLWSPLPTHGHTHTHLYNLVHWHLSSVHLIEFIL